MELYRVVNTVFTSNSYVLSDGSDEVVLIDIGDFSPIEQYLKTYRKKVKGVFLTHTHYDHIYGIRDLVKAYPGCKVYTSEFGKKALASDRLNFSRYHNDAFCWQYEHLTVLSDGDRLDVFPGVELEVLATPGHDKSCLTYRMGRYLFSGDSFIPQVKVMASFPQSNKEDAQRAVRRILSIADGCCLCPGHGAVYENFRVLDE